MSSLKTQTLSGLIWGFAEKFSVQVVQFVLTIFLARLLSPSEYGLIAMLTIFIAISQVFIDSGFSSALIQSQEKKDEDFNTVFIINLSISVLCYILLFVSAPYIAQFYSQPLLCSILRIYSLNMVLNALVAVHKTKLVIKVDFKTQSKISFIAVLLSGIIGIVCALNGLKVWSLVIQTLSLGILNVVLYNYFVKWFPNFTFSKESFRRLFSFGSKLLMASLIGTIYNNIYSLVIGKKFPPEYLGNYSRGHQFSYFITDNISGILQKVTFPILSQIQNSDEQLLVF